MHNPELEEGKRLQLHQRGEGQGVFEMASDVLRPSQPFWRGCREDGKVCECHSAHGDCQRAQGLQGLGRHREAGKILGCASKAEGFRPGEGSMFSEQPDQCQEEADDIHR